MTSNFLGPNGGGTVVYSNISGNSSKCKKEDQEKGQKKKQDVESGGDIDEWMEDGNCKPRTHCKLKFVFGEGLAGA